MVHSFAPRVVFVGLLWRDDALAGDVLRQLTGRWGRVVCETPAAAFTQSMYYADEFGGGLLRRFAAFEQAVAPETLWQIKLWTNEIETAFADPHTGHRRVNIDPGTISPATVILATTKDFAHRVPLAGGIYAETTLRYERGSFQPLPWTYPDYQTGSAIEFFNTARLGALTAYSGSPRRA